MTTERSLRTSAAKQCRICLDNNNIQDILSPCNCRGSIQHVHLDCITQYFQHKFEHGSRTDRRRMKQSIKCEICHSEIRCLKVAPSKRCLGCGELCERVEGEDIFFMVIFMFLYIGFHAVGVVLILQEDLVSRVIGVVWLLVVMVMFNYALWKIVKEVCYVKEAKVSYRPER